MRVRCGRVLSPDRVRIAGMSSRDRVRVRDPVKQVLHLRAGLEQQVPAVFGLVDRVAVTESAALLLIEVQAEAQTGRIDPPVADLAQAPYSRITRPGISDPGATKPWDPADESLAGQPERALQGIVGDPRCPARRPATSVSICLAVVRWCSAWRTRMVTVSGLRRSEFGQRPPIRHAQGLKYVCNESPARPAAS